MHLIREYLIYCLHSISQTQPVYFETLGWLETGVYIMEDLLGGDQISGPAVIMDKLSTILIEPDCTAEISVKGDIRVSVGDAVKAEIGTQLDTIHLSIFSHRFMSIAEQMGRILQRTAISTNIKERYV